MKNLVLILTLLLASTAFSQSNNDELKSGGRVKTDKPTVYLEYVCQDEKKIKLRMYNNTIWHVSIGAEKSYFPTKTPIKLGNGANVYAIPNDEEISGIHYYIETDKLADVKKLKTPKTDFYTNGGGWIASQDSVLFSVPIEHLRKGLKIYVDFSYEWEMTRSGNMRNEPEHRAYFRGGDIGSANTEIEPTACQK